MQEFIPYQLPLILGWDVSGVVEAVGAEVTDFNVGDEIYSRPDLTRSGAYAEYMVLRASEAAHKPRSIDHIHAAAVPLAALIDEGTIKPIVETVLPLSEARQAHELSESGHTRGKIVLRVAD